ncbi:MAG TPA: STAS domain-containing protein [Herpetosiphonaceae bacterium]|nr:STAS domain-containing protein [Herpetosiphonaceae bacterium]
MRRFEHIDLEVAMAAHDMPMYILERTGTGADPEYRIYPLNQAAQIGYSSYERTQGMLVEEYAKPMPHLLPIFKSHWKPVLIDGEATSSNLARVTSKSGEALEFETTLYRIEWTPEHATAVAVGRDVTELNRTIRELRAANEHLAAQAELIETMSVPVATIWHGVVYVPIVGTVDSRRAMNLMQGLLDGITRHRAVFAILDISGVPVIDTQVAQYLLQTIQAATLLGCRCIVIGISPEIAQTVVQLGIDLRTLETTATIQDGLKIAFQALGYSVVAGGQ